MLINNEAVVGEKFAYDGCHKIYILESEDEEREAREMSYEIFDISELKKVYKNSCGLEFISNWSLDTMYVEQFPEKQPIFA